MGGLIEGFWSDESDPFIRRMILDEAAGKHQGSTRWDFNVFGLVLDFDNGRAVVEDLLAADESESMDLETFLRDAAAFGDDQSQGDGLTEAQRHPPTYVADTSGHVERIDE